MSRPADWAPLADSDPIGGNVAAVSSAAKRYAAIAEDIETQVARLKKIAGQDEMLGKTAGKLREAAGDLQDKLEKTHGRFEGAGAALGRWHPHLQAAQDDTLAALNAARDAQVDVTANAPLSSPPPADPTPDQQAAVKARSTRHDQAGGDLAAARRRFEDAVTERDHQARIIADAIRESLHDGLKDGFWDHIGAWVDRHVAMIKTVVEVLSWVATALAVVALFCTPAGWVAFAVMGLVALGHVALAASSNGSWTDVAIDAFSLATLGVGAKLAAAGKLAKAGALERGAAMEGGQARNAVLAERGLTKTGLEKASSNVFKRHLTRDGRAAVKALRGFDDTTAATAKAAQESRAAAVKSTKFAKATRVQRAAALQADRADQVAGLRQMDTMWGADPQFAARATAARSAFNAGRAVTGAAAAVDLTDKSLMHSSIPGVRDVKPYSSGYEDFKETAGGFIGTHLRGVGVQ